ncbi:MAG: hypothetical protein ACKVOW_07490 [Chitinophagaceae bacterium]
MEQIKEIKKVLIGWQEFNGASLLVGGNANLITPDLQATVNAAILAIQNRPNYVNPVDIVSDPEPELEEYIQQFWLQLDTLPYSHQGFVVKLVDIGNVCTVQPVVECIQSKERTKEIAPNDFLAMARICLSKPSTMGILGNYDANKKSYSFSSPNPNLQILTPHADQGFFGFAVGVSNSFVQVVKCNGRYFLRDGNHRAYGFLANNVRKIPVLYREFHTIGEMGLPAGLFPIETLIGNKPPLLSDFLDDTVSTTAEFLRPTKVVIIQGLEILTT